MAARTCPGAAAEDFCPAPRTGPERLTHEQGIILRASISCPRPWSETREDPVYSCRSSRAQSLYHILSSSSILFSLPFRKSCFRRNDFSGNCTSLFRREEAALPADRSGSALRMNLWAGETDLLFAARAEPGTAASTTGPSPMKEPPPDFALSAASFTASAAFSAVLETASAMFSAASVTFSAAFSTASSI